LIEGAEVDGDFALGWLSALSVVSLLFSGERFYREEII
jgi:hypothetical protein